ncbi:MAG TPA: hypothetical protein VF532_03980 [Candidatus Angelobacter sp.]
MADRFRPMPSTYSEAKFPTTVDAAFSKMETHAREVGSNLGNSYIGVAFEGNGLKRDATTGNACIQNGFGISFIGDYFENFSNQSPPYQAWIGDAVNQSVGVVFSGSVFASVDGTRATLHIANSDGATISGNTEVAAIPSFIKHSRKSSRTFLYPNTVFSCSQRR